MSWKSFFSKVATVVTNVVEKTAAGSALVAKVAEGVSWAAGAVSTAVSWVGDKVTTAANWIGETVSTATSFVAETSASSAGWTVEKISEAANYVLDKASEAYAWGKDTVSEASGWIKDAVATGSQYVSETKELVEDLTRETGTTTSGAAGSDSLAYRDYAGLTTTSGSTEALTTGAEKTGAQLLAA